MILVYLDESGNSGNNLTHPQQPLFCLAALLVPESSWVAVEADLSGDIGCVRQVQQKGWVKAGRGQVVYGSGLVDLSRFGGNI